MPHSSPTVLVIDDDADTRRNLRDILELDNLQVETAGTIAEALRRDDWPRFAAVILDRRLPDGSSEEFLPRLKQLAPAAVVIIVTGYADLEGVIAAIHQGAADYLLKPIDLQMMKRKLFLFQKKDISKTIIYYLTKTKMPKSQKLNLFFSTIALDATSNTSLIP